MENLNEILPRLRLFANALATDETAQSLAQNIGISNWVLLLAHLAETLPLYKAWIDQICSTSVDKLEYDFQNEDDLVIFLKSLRILVSRRHVVAHNQVNINLGKILHLFGHENQFVSFQIKSLFHECLHLPMSSNKVFSEVDVSSSQNMPVYQDFLLESAIGSHSCSDETISTGITNRLVYSIQLLRQWECDNSMLSRSFVISEGLVIPSEAAEDRSEQLVVRTDSVDINLNALLQSILTELPVLIHGPTGCGKTVLIKEMARVMGLADKLVILHISDQTDTKALLGSYTCTDVPGEFVWIPGAITSAVMHGHWILVEDIDKVPLDFVALFTPLLESRRLQVPALGIDLTAHPLFRVFGTKSSSKNTFLAVDEADSEVSVEIRSAAIPQLSNFLRHWYPVQMIAPKADEIRQIVLTICPKLPLNFLEKVLVCLHNIEGANLRDILKIIRRIESYVASYVNDRGYITDSLRLLALKEIADVMLFKIRSHQPFISALEALAVEWNIAQSDLQALMLEYAPPIEYHPSADGGMQISVGRANLNTQIATPLDRHDQSISSFAQTAYVRRILEKLAVCVQMNEPVILVGETGNGKTTNVQELARLLGKKLVVQNLSLSSDISDLLGGYRPVTIRQLFRPIYEQFVSLFESSLSASKNSDYLQKVAQLYHQESWSKFLKAVDKVCQSILGKLTASGNGQKKNSRLEEWQVYHATILRYLNNLHKIQAGFAFSFIRGMLLEAFQNGYWILLDEINLASSETLQGLSGFLDVTQTSMIIDDGGMAHGSHAIHRHKDFRIFAAMNPPTDICKKELPPSIRSRFTELYIPELLEQQDLLSIVASYFVGINDAPVFDIVKTYLACRAAAEDRLMDGSGQKPRYSLRSLTRSLRCALNFMKINIRPLGRCLYEGFLLNFCVMLTESSQQYMMDFLRTQLYPEASKKDLNFPPHRPREKLEGGMEWVLVKPFWIPSGNLPLEDWAVKNDSGMIKFVMTESVLKNVRVIAAAVACHAGSILLQGPTSIGKTSMVQYLAARLGKKCVRINNHEHTDVQEYIGGYITGVDGKLAFHDGLLVEALRNGYWIILDELNLAPSDVLEALNRLLDDNKELLIPETGEIVKPAEGFQLFATQNPPGVYGGRKPLSLAFRNRFVEIDLSDLPTKEIEEIVTHSCGIAPKFSAMMVKVMESLQMHRQNSSMFLGKHGVVTTRDLIKWGRRQPQSNLEVSQTGFMLLAEKLRTSEERDIVKNILQDICKVKGIVETIYDIGITGEGRSAADCLVAAQNAMRSQSLAVEGVKGVAITEPLRRMWSLLYHAMHFSEPVLMVGETGCGKTMVCQLYAAYRGQRLRILNCHQSTETADLIGGLRPLRSKDIIKEELIREINSCLSNGLQEIIATDDLNLPFDMNISDIELSSAVGTLLERASDMEHSEELLSYLNDLKNLRGKLKSLFEWVDGPLIEAMRNGDILLIDEINLAEDAVIERLNSVLETHREITLAEKGGLVTESIVAHPHFRIIATMNPSGDFGKRELSPALRSRFSEIWIPAYNSYADFALIIGEILGNIQFGKDGIVTAMIAFMKWFNAQMASLMINNVVMTARELIAWAEFVNASNSHTEVDAASAVVHGAFLTLLDGLGIGHNISREIVRRVKQDALEQLISGFAPEHAQYIRQSLEFLIFASPNSSIVPVVTNEEYCLGNYAIGRGQYLGNEVEHHKYATDAPSTILNLGRLLRAMKIKRPILLEGPPGVGKTSIVSHLARASGHKLVRINLSEHTELSDLMGCDLPSSSNDDQEPTFKWFDGILVKAMKEGSWVLLDELNLAPQTVLEGMNACFDHREQVFLPEIGRTVHCAPSFRVFGAQNPMTEGGGRKGLPASFLSRFTRVYVESMTEDDLTDILTAAYAPVFRSLSFNESIFAQMVSFVSRISHDITFMGSYGQTGSPWEFNLRDMLRWCEWIEYAIKQRTRCSPQEVLQIGAYFLFVLRMRTIEDREKICDVYQMAFGGPLHVSTFRDFFVGDQDSSVLSECQPTLHLPHLHHHHILPSTLDFESANSFNSALLAWCVALKWPVLLVGPNGSGKRSMIERVAIKTGHIVRYFSAIPSLDTSELLGAFEQTDKERSIRGVFGAIKDALVILTSHFINSSDRQSCIMDSLERVYAAVHKYDAEAEWSGAELRNDITAVFSSMETLRDDLHLDNSILAQFERTFSVAKSHWTALSVALDAGGQSFTWLNGIVVDAMEKGHWLLFDNVNLCSSSVLDRLNSLLEPNGELILNEDGSGRRVHRSENFRVFFVMDSAMGEVSRAMRNRCLEIFVDKPQSGNLLTQNHLRSLNVLLDGKPSGEIINLYRRFRKGAQGYDIPHLQQSLHLLAVKEALRHFASSANAVTKRNELNRMHNVLIVASHGWISEVQLALLSLLYGHWSSDLLKSTLSAALELVQRSFGSSSRNVLKTHWALLSSYLTPITMESAVDFEVTEMDRIAILTLLSMTAVIDHRPAALLEILLDTRDKQPFAALYHIMTAYVASAQQICASSDMTLFLKTVCMQRGLAIVASQSSETTAQRSFLHLSHAVHSGTILPDSKEIVLIGYVYPIIVHSEVFLLSTAASNQQGNQKVSEKIVVALHKRDMLVDCLRSLEWSSDRVSIPWELVLIPLNWLKKAIDVVAALTGVQGDSFVALMNSFDAFFLQMKTLWKSASPMQKMTLWKYSGHSMVFRKADHWTTWAAFQEIAERFAIKLPSFVDNARMVSIWDGKSRDDDQAQRLEDWLGLFATFYGNHTDEIDEDLRAAMRLGNHQDASSFSTLLEPFQQQIVTRMDQSTMHADEESPVELLLREETLSRIRSELKGRSCLGVRFFGDIVVAKCHESLLLSLSKMICTPNDFKATGLKLLEVLRIGLAMGLCHSSHSPTVFRPWKTLLWFLEFILALDQASFERLPWMSISKLLRSLRSSISAQALDIVAHNMINHVEAIDLSYNSPTLASALVNAPSRGSDRPVPGLRSDVIALTGWARLHQAINVSFALRHADLGLLFPQSPSLKAFVSRKETDSTITLAAFDRTRSALAVNLLAATADNEVSLRCAELNALISTSDTMLMLSDIAVLNKHLFSPSIHAGIDNLKHCLSLDELVSAVEALNLPKNSIDSQVSSLIASCLSPALKEYREMQLPTEYAHLRAVVANSYLSICLATLTAQLLLSSSPIDPAMKPYHKHNLLQPQVGIMSRSVQLRLVANALAGTNLLDDQCIDTAVLASEYRLRDEKYLRKSIERPVDGPNYVELYTMLVSILQGPLAVSSVLSLANRFEDLVCQSHRLQSSDLVAVQQQEINFQSVLHNLHTTLVRSYASFEDITSVFCSCIQRISKGLRLLSATGYAMLHQRKGSKTSAMSWKNLLSGNCHTIGEDYSSVVHGKGQRQEVMELLNPDNAFIREFTLTAQVHANSLIGRSFEQEELQGFLLNANRSMTLVAFQKMWGWLTSGVGNRETLLPIVDSAMKLIVNQYLAIKNTERDRKAQEASLFVRKKAKTVSNTASIDTAKGDIEEESAFRENFPDHLQDLVMLYDEDNVPDALTKSSDVEASLLSKDRLLEDDNILQEFISMHASMTLLHHSDYMQIRRPSQAISKEDYLADMRFHFRRQLNYAILLGKAYGDFAHNVSSQSLAGEDISIYAFLFNQLMEQHVAGSNASPLPNQIDRDLLLLLDATGNRSQGLIGQQSDDIQMYNPKSFHFDSNIPEVTKFNGPLNQVLSRALGLLQQFPNNDVLVRIIRLSFGISLLHVTVPIGKLVNSIQLLLKLINQYEETAHRQISFANEIALLSSLLNHYRAIELQSWKTLLRGKEVIHAKNTIPYWFSLLKMFKFEALEACKTIKLKVDASANVAEFVWRRLGRDAPQWLFALDTASSLTDGDVAESFLEDKLRTLDNFLSESTVGEFAMRLHLVRLLAISIEQDVQKQYSNKEDVRAKFVKKYQRLLFGVWRHYSQYLPLARQFQSLLADPLQTQVNSEIKMNKWDNITVVAMIENSEKVNRKLNKFLRQYEEEVLTYPVKRLIFRDNMKDIVSDTGELLTVTKLPTDSSLFPHLPQISSEEALEAVIEHYGRRMTKRATKSASKDMANLEVPGNSVELKWLTKLPKLITKIQSRVAACFHMPSAQELNDDPYRFSGLCFGLNSSLIVEELCSTIFERLQTLRGEKVNRQLKIKALKDLMICLKEQGFSHLRSESPCAYLHRSVDILSTHGALSQLEAKSLTFPSHDSSSGGLLYRAESYVIRCMTELAQLHVQVGGQHSGDIARADASHMAAFSDSMITHCLKLRVCVESGLLSLERSHQLLSKYRSYSDYFAVEAPFPLIEMQSAATENAHHLRLVLQDLISVQSIAQASDKAKTTMNNDKTALRTTNIHQVPWSGVVETLHRLAAALAEVVAVDVDNKGDESVDLVTAPDISFGAARKLRREDIEAQVALADRLSTELAPIFEMLSCAIGQDLPQRVMSLLAKVGYPKTQSLSSQQSEELLARSLQDADNLISRCLIKVQHMQTLQAALCNAQEAPNNIHGAFNELLLEKSSSIDASALGVVAIGRWACAALAHCNMDDIQALAQRVIASWDAMRDTTHQKTIASLSSQVLNVLDLLYASSCALVDQAVVALKSQAKLTYICVRIFRNLLSKGFCDSESRETDGDGDGSGQGPTEWEDDVEGTGMGEGEGKKDVSDQITNEEQLLGLKEELGKNEKDQSQQNQQKKKDDKLTAEEQDHGVEMDQDFEGDMYDMDQQENDNEEDEESDGEESIDRELDQEQREMNLDDIVAEKEWGSDDEDGDEDAKDANEKFERGSSMKGEAIKDEMRTREDDEEAKDPDHSPGDEEEEGVGKDSKDREEQSDGEGEDRVNEDREEDYMDRPQGVEVQKDDKGAPNDKDDDEGEGEDQEDGSEGEGGEDGEEAEREADYTAGEDGVDNGDAEPEGPEDAQDIPDDLQLDGAEDKMDDDSEEAEEDAQDAPAEADAAGGFAMEEEGDEAAEDDTSIRDSMPPKPQTTKKPPAFGVQSPDGQDDILGGETEQSNNAQSHASGSADNGAEQPQSQSNGGGGDGNRGEHGQRHSRQDNSRMDQSRPENNKDDKAGADGQNASSGDRSKSTPFREAPNPFTHRGDLQKEWFRRLNITENGNAANDEGAESEEEEGAESAGADKQPHRGEGMFEFNGQGNEQVLGAVAAEDVARLPEENEVPRDGNEDSSRERKRELEEAQDEGADSAADQQEGDEARQRKRPRKDRNTSEAMLREDSMPEEVHPEEEVDEADEMEVAPVEAEPIAGDEMDDEAVSASAKPLKIESHTKRDFKFGKTSMMESAEESDVEIEVITDRSTAVVSREAQERWQRCLSLTEAHALRLCEQLRLILEPTLASRLQGDYRTGKRINMRRVISYIASGYRKDKIWLRRTKLAKRAYQVMLLIDDSKSMASAGALAMEALALISTALSRLEIGELCVASFAEQVRVLHDFQQAFSSQSGAQVLSQFNFDAGATRLNDALGAVLPIFERARNTSQSAHQGPGTAVLQLCFVLSDARIDTDNRTRLEQAVRRMSEQHILVVLVIVDQQQHQRDSIFNTRSVSFVNNKVVTTNYLDNFPFPFYVVIQDLHRLPEVLADALKQWFELVKAQLSQNA